MAIQIGQQLGSLEVTALVGKGGMGEVYRWERTDRTSRTDTVIAVQILDRRRGRMKSIWQLYPRCIVPASAYCSGTDTVKSGVLPGYSLHEELSNLQKRLIALRASY
jgi:hypothetical protein